MPKAEGLGQIWPMADPSWATDAVVVAIGVRVGPPPGSALKGVKITRRPSTMMGSLFEGTRLDDFFGAMDWVVHELRHN